MLVLDEKHYDSLTAANTILNLFGEGEFVGSIVRRVRVGSIAPGLGRGRITLEFTGAVSAEVVHVGSVRPLGVDRSVVVESTLIHHSYYQNAMRN